MLYGKYDGYAEDNIKRLQDDRLSSFLELSAQMMRKSSDVQLVCSEN